MGRELGRKALHIAMGGFAFLLRWLAPWQAALLALTALLFNGFLLHRLTRRRLLRERELARELSVGILLYPAAVLGLILVFWNRLELAAASWGLLAFGDGMATVAGLLVGGPRLPWNRAKSWAGLVAFVLYGTAGAALLIVWTQRAVIDAAQRGTPAPSWIGGSFLDDGLGGALLPQPLLLLLGCLVAAVVAALAESLETGVDDNLIVPLAGGAALYGASLVEPARLIAASGLVAGQLAWGAAVNAALAAAAIAARSVSLSGALWGWVLGSLLFAFGGWRGFLMLLLFFVLGTAATRLGYGRKEALGLAQENHGRRGARHAFANVTTGAVFAFLAVATSYPEVCTLALVAAFATAACDTVSSEVGQAFARRHYLVTTLRRVRAGTDGAVSAEGTAAGAGAALLLATAAWWVGLVSPAGAVVVVVSALAGATLESYVGATMQRWRWVDNELVNFSNTLAGAMSACLLYALWLS